MNKIGADALFKIGSTIAMPSCAVALAALVLGHITGGAYGEYLLYCAFAGMSVGIIFVIAWFLWAIWHD